MERITRTIARPMRRELIREVAITYDTVNGSTFPDTLVDLAPQWHTGESTGARPLIKELVIYCPDSRPIPTRYWRLLRRPILG